MHHESRRPFSASLRGVAALALLLPAGCDSGDWMERAGPSAPEPDPPVLEPEPAPWDSRELREVAELQVDRDAEGLRERLSAREASVRARAAFALASLDEHGAAGELEELLDDPRAEVRRSAAFALGHAPPPGGTGVLLEALEGEETPEVREQLLVALARHGDAGTGEALLELERLEPGEEPHRTAALSQLGARETPTDRVLDALVERLRHEDPEVRRAAALFFAFSRAEEVWEERAHELRDVLDGYPLDEPAAMYLLMGMGLHDHQDDSAVLVRWMREAEDWRLRVAAANALGANTHLAAEGTREALLEQVREGPRHVAAAATTSYMGGVFRPPEVREWMRSWVEEGPVDRWRTQGQALQSLAPEGPEVPLEWARRAADEHPMAARNALGLLEMYPTPEVRDFVRELAEHEDASTRAAATELLARHTMMTEMDEETLEEIFGRLEGMMREGSPEAVSRAAGAVVLPSFGAVDSPSRVVAAAEDRAAEDPPPSVLVPLLHAVGEIGPEEEGLTFAQRYEDHPDVRVRTAARWAAGLIREEEGVGPRPPEAEAELDWDYLEALGPEPRLRLELEHGEVVIRLAPRAAPLTVQTVARLAEEGSYDGVPFHRVVPNSVAQGGDYTRGDGTGSPHFSLRTELTRIPFRRGAVGMASGGRDTEGSQFFITHSWQPHYRFEHTALGWVESGGAVVDAILPGDRIRRARVERGEPGV